MVCFNSLFVEITSYHVFLPTRFMLHIEGTERRNSLVAVAP